MYNYYELLVYIAKQAGAFGSFSSNTGKMGKALTLSQQSVSRKLREMESFRLIKREVRVQGITLGLDQKGRQFLAEQQKVLSSIFKKQSKLTGWVVKGLGEGKYYMSLAGYQQQFKKKLGFLPFLGTLNVKVDKQEALGFIASLEKVIISGFASKERSFGGLVAHKVKVNGVLGCLVIPDRTQHDISTIELIAPFSFKKKLGLKEGSKVKIEKSL